MNSKRLLILVTIFVLLNAILFFFVNNKNSTKTTYNAPLQTLQNTIQTNSISAPVALSHKGVGTVLLVYNFFGKVTRKDTVGVNTQLTLDISDSNLPNFIATKDTRVSRAENSILTPSTLDSVNVGTNVSLSTTYDLKTKTWILRDVFIIIPTASPSPSSSTK